MNRHAKEDEASTGRMEEVHALGGLVCHLGLESERDMGNEFVVQQL